MYFGETRGTRPRLFLAVQATVASLLVVACGQSTGSGDGPAVQTQPEEGSEPDPQDGLPREGAPRLLAQYPPDLSYEVSETKFQEWIEFTEGKAGQAPQRVSFAEFRARFESPPNPESWIESTFRGGFGPRDRYWISWAAAALMVLNESGQERLLRSVPTAWHDAPILFLDGGFYRPLAVLAQYGTSHENIKFLVDASAGKCGTDFYFYGPLFATQERDLSRASKADREEHYEIIQTLAAGCGSGDAIFNAVRSAAINQDRKAVQLILGEAGGSVEAERFKRAGLELLSSDMVRYGVQRSSELSCRCLEEIFSNVYTRNFGMLLTEEAKAHVIKETMRIWKIAAEEPQFRSGFVGSTACGRLLDSIAQSGGVVGRALLDAMLEDFSVPTICSMGEESLLELALEQRKFHIIKVLYDHDSGFVLHQLGQLSQQSSAGMSKDIDEIIYKLQEK